MSPGEDDPSLKQSLAQRPIMHPPPRPSSSVLLRSRGNAISLHPRPTMPGEHFAPKVGGKPPNPVISIVFQLRAGKAAGLGEPLVEDAIAMVFRSGLGEMHGCHGAGGSKNSS